MLPAEFWWHVAKRLDDIPTLFGSWALTCKMFYEITKDTGVYQHLVLHTLAIPKPFFRALKAKGQWFEVIRRWHQINKCHKELYAAPFMQQRSRRRDFYQFQFYVSGLKELAKQRRKKFLKHLLCSVCNRSVIKPNWRPSSYYFFLVEGSFICRRCAGADGEYRRKVLTLDQIQLMDGDRCLALAAGSPSVWHRLIRNPKPYEFSKLLITSEDYEHVLYENMSNAEILAKHREISQELDKYEEDVRNLHQMKTRLNNALEQAMTDLASNLNSMFHCSIQKPHSLEMFQIIESRASSALRTINYLVRDHEFPLKEQILYFQKLRNYLGQELPTIVRLQRQVQRYETVPTATREKRTRYRQKKLFWYQLLKRRGLLKCSAILVDGKRRCSLRTDGFHELCGLHQKMNVSATKKN
jgi:hypothetical protein